MGEEPEENRVVAGIEALTDKEGPLVQLVLEVKKSNSFARRNQRWLQYVMVALVACLVGLTFVVLSLQR